MHSIIIEILNAESTHRNNIIRSYSIFVAFCQHQDLKSRDRGSKCRAESKLRQ